MVSISTIVLYKETCRTLGLNPVICFFMKLTAQLFHMLCQ